MPTWTPSEQHLINTKHFFSSNVSIKWFCCSEGIEKGLYIFFSKCTTYSSNRACRISEPQGFSNHPNSTICWKEQQRKIDACVSDWWILSQRISYAAGVSTCMSWRHHVFTWYTGWPRGARGPHGSWKTNTWWTGASWLSGRAWGSGGPRDAGNLKQKTNYLVYRQPPTGKFEQFWQGHLWYMLSQTQLDYFINISSSLTATKTKKKPLLTLMSWKFTGDPWILSQRASSRHFETW